LCEDPVDNRRPVSSIHLTHLKDWIFQAHQITVQNFYKLRMTQRKMRTLSHERAAEDIEPDEDELAADDVSQETVVATPAEDDDEVSLNAG